MGENGCGNGNRAYEALGQTVSGIRRRAIRFTLVALGFNALLYTVMAWWLKDMKRATEVFTSIFQYQVVGWCCSFMYPYFLRMEVKTDLALQQGRDVAGTLAEVKDDLKPIIDDAKAIVHDLRQAVDKYSHDDVVKGVIAEIKKELDSEGGLVRRLEGKFDEIIVAFTRPIGPVRPMKAGLLEMGIPKKGALEPDASGNGSGVAVGETGSGRRSGGD